MHRIATGLPRVVFASVAFAALLAACGQVGTAPTPTPADFGGIAIRLSALGIVPIDMVSGDPGCTDPNLARTAVSFTASGLDQSTPVRIHVYIFANNETQTRLRPDVDSCARSYVTDPATYEAIDVPPYVAAGQGPWGKGFEAAMRTGLSQAAQSGG